MRLTLVCTTASTEPTTSDSTASTQMTGRQSSRWNGSAITSTRSIAANAAALPADAMNAVTGDGAPWYTSGVHTWNGAAATLNPRPTISRAMPASTSVFGFSMSTVVCDRGDHLADVRRARAAVDERDAVEEERRREPAEHEVLDARLRRSAIAAPVARRRARTARATASRGRGTARSGRWPTPSRRRRSRRPGRARRARARRSASRGDGRRLSNDTSSSAAQIVIVRNIDERVERERAADQRRSGRRR